jgi:3-hydroxyisobutyrate dehydrogenase-like beta-hydroxyacid dehydrogenase
MQFSVLSHVILASIILTLSSQDTHTRVQKASIEALPTDTSLVSASDYILSIVPPRDALATAKRITTAFKTLPTPKPKPLYYIDLNAISPGTARSIAALFTTQTPTINFLDGGIIGSPPSLKETTWSLPSIPISGSHSLTSAISGTHLQESLNIKHIGPEVGSASGLKCCFASTTKGFTALCIQSFTTAQSLGVLPNLLEEMEARLPNQLKSAQRGLTAMPPKAYRWVKEMEEIAMCHSDEGGFEGEGKGIFDAVAEVYRSVADETVLGEEKTERRKRGLTVEDVAGCVGEGLMKKRKKVE